MTNNEKHKADVMEALKPNMAAIFVENGANLIGFKDNYYDALHTITTQYTAYALEWAGRYYTQVIDGIWNPFSLTTSELVALFGEQEYKEKK